MGALSSRKVAEAINVGIDIIEKKADGIALQKKLELKDELSKELITKAEFFGEIKTVRQEMETLRQEMQTIRQEIQTMKVELEGKIAKLDQKFNFMIILMIIALTLMNPVVAEIIKKALKL